MKSGYELQVTPSDLISKVDAVPKKAAGRDLMTEEIQLRNTWIQIIYLVLIITGYKIIDDGLIGSIDESLISVYKAKIETLSKRKENCEDFSMDDLVDVHDMTNDPIANVIMTQSLRVVWFTFIVLEEEERCKYEFARQDAPLRPPIPGAF